MAVFESLSDNLPFAVVVAGCVLLVILWAIRPSLPRGGPVYRHRRYHKRVVQWRGGERKVVPNAAPVTDAGQQLKTVMSATFTKQRVLSTNEARVLAETERAIAQLAKPWRVMAQVSLGEILRSTDAAAFSAINSKRVDLLIVDEKHVPIAAVEYQGAGHWQGSGAARDAVKKEALRKAGIDYIEVMAGSHLPIDLHRQIERIARPSSLALA